MVQIAFLTFFLSLTSGAHPVEVSVAGPVAAVELLLDGAPVGRLDGPPWAHKVDFGPDLMPHELVARALDGGGAELARARQWVNLPRPPAEVSLALEEDGEGRATSVRLTSQALIKVEPKQISLTLDGLPLALDAQGRAALPRRDPGVPHVLSAELVFGPGVEARRDVVLGAGGGEAFGELTAVPVRGRTQAPERMQSWFAAGGVPLRPVAVEKQPGQLVVVRDIGSRALLRAIAGPGSGYSLSPAESMLGREDRIRFLWPRPRRGTSASGIPVELFDLSADYFTRKHGGLHLLLGRITLPEENPEGQHLADAVAVAGLKAAAGNRPRAVLLVLGRDPGEQSVYSPATARRYLEALGVPLHVWSLVKLDASTAAAAWGKVEDVSTLSRMLRATEHLRDDLRAQRMVFFEGLHLPQSIQATPAAAPGVELP